MFLPMNIVCIALRDFGGRRSISTVLSLLLFILSTLCEKK